MARFASRAETEPLMRLERPSTASSQSTAHVINECFRDLLGKQPLDRDVIRNLALSRRKEHNYLDASAKELKEVCLLMDFKLSKTSTVSPLFFSLPPPPTLSL